MKRARGLILGVAVLAAGCSSDSEAGPMDGSWAIVEIDGQPIVVGENTAVPPSLEISGGSASGVLGCNDGSASFDFTDRVLDIVSLEVTEKDCIPVAVTFAESAMLDVLEDGIIEWSREGDRVVWVAAGRQIVLELASS